MLLTSKQIVLLLERLKEETVVEPSEQFPYRVSRRAVTGYSQDNEIGQLQATLSIMLELATRRGK